MFPMMETQKPLSAEALKMYTHIEVALHIADTLALLEGDKLLHEQETRKLAQVRKDMEVISIVVIIFLGAACLVLSVTGDLTAIVMTLPDIGVLAYRKWRKV
jgi:hypothetical protein